MLNISTSLKNAILTGAVCQYMKITLSDNSVIAVTNHDVEFDLGGDTYKPSPNLQTIRMIQTLGQQVNSQTAFVTWFEGLLSEEDLKGGEYDDCQFEFGWIAWDISPKERMIHFSGKIGEISFDDTGASFEALDDMKQLERNYGRTYSSQDPFTFGDSQFGLSEASWTESGEIDTIYANRFRFKATGDSNFESKADNWFVYGKITFTSGNNSGWSGEIKIHETVGSDIIMELFIPSPYSMQVGDTFDVVAGYDGSFDQSKNKFSNGINYGGFPHIKPIEETD